MANSIEKAVIYQKALDEQMTQEAVTGWMDANTNNALYAGGATIKVPKITLDGLGDYSRSSGYPGGSVTLAYEALTMTKDRAKSFDIDAMDAEESGIDALMGKVMSTFQRVHVIPEVDSYRLAKLYALAASKSYVNSAAYTPAKGTILGKLLDDITAVKERVGTGEKLVVHISLEAWNILNQTSEIQKQLNSAEFVSGKVHMQVKAIDDDVVLIPTASARMKTAYSFHDGSSKFGYEPQAEVKSGETVTTPAAKQMNWIIVGQRAPIAPCKTDLIRLFDPQTWQKANAWHADYRKYHDLWVPDNMLDLLQANTK